MPIRRAECQVRSKPRYSTRSSARVGAEAKAHHFGPLARTTQDAPRRFISRAPSMARPVQRDAGDSAERARLRSSPGCQAEDALFAARSLQAQHLVLGAPLFAVPATT